MSHDLRQQRRRPVRASRSVSPVKVSVAILVSAVAVVALFAAGIAAQQFSGGLPVAGQAAGASAGPATPSPSPKKTGPAFGDPVRDGQFEFTVTRVDCSKSTVGLEHIKRTAEGRFCVISLTVRNIGDDSKYFVGQAQTAYDGSGTAYDSDELAGLYANRGVEAFVQKLAPAEKVTGKLVFDVPKNVALTTLELHDSPLSGGVLAPLR
ncbi:hypothetical protein Q0Z83_021090 [Actinoplanes sichuanensis]|uniref:DUF4352 domain-containing protein n=1 Tax=Actinoplanes sichuanensis TaxID=512349 RepID=A0ABW4AIC4_9ACTN|nr:DUF4352 domain-containing protein [Actinoplanes sichuanensis]BEL03918.1 hypothetical protein Q0Z83_021090 [Actinoplanes sichuanensis]